MDIHQILTYNRTPTRRLQFSSEIPETPRQPIHESQISTQRWDSQNGVTPPRTPISDSDSTQSWDSHNGRRPEHLSPRIHVPQRIEHDRNEETSRDKRIQIRTALLFKIPYKQICEKLFVTNKQIKWARRHRPTPQKKSHCGRAPKANTPVRQYWEQWLLESPSHRHIPFHNLPQLVPNVFNGYGEQAIHTGFKLVGYGRRTAKRKGFSDEPDVMAERVAFAEQAIHWSRERLYRQIFSDEVWAMGGAHSQEYVTVKEDGSDRYNPACLTHKYSKRPSWMFHGTIVFGGKQSVGRRLLLDLLILGNRQRTSYILGEGMGHYEFVQIQRYYTQ